jgi:hypothetical protein
VLQPICRAAGYAGIVYNVVHDVNLLRNGDWLEAALDSPAGEIAVNVVGVAEDVSAGNVTGVAWRSLKSIPAVGIIEGFASGSLTLNPSEWEYRPWKW